jgi:hypothetical protein
MRNLLLCVGVSGDDRGDWIAAVNGFRKTVPWWARIGVKIALARLSLPYRIWKQLQIFEHGDMNQPGRALDTFLEHARTAGVLDTESHLPRIKVKGDNFNVLELGPGDSLFTAVITHSLGASRTWLVGMLRGLRRPICPAMSGFSSYCGKGALLYVLNASGRHFPIFYNNVTASI